MKSEQNKTQYKSKSAVFRVLTFFLLTAACIIFSILCLHQTPRPFFQSRKILFSILTAVFFVFLYALAIWSVVKQKAALRKAFISVYAFLLFCLVLVFILQKTGFFRIIQDKTAFQNYLERAGIWMPLLYIVLQYLQVVVLPIPGIVSTAAGVALFGAFYATLYSIIGIILGSLTAFFIGRKLGYKAAAWLVGEEALCKWQKRLKGKDNFILTAMFLLPLFPDDILCFLAGLSSMTTKYFIGMIIITRLIAISATCYSIDFIPLTTWWGVLLWGILFLLVVVAFWLVYKNMDTLQAWYSRIFKKKKKGKNK